MRYAIHVFVLLGILGILVADAIVISSVAPQHIRPTMTAPLYKTPELPRLDMTVPTRDPTTVPSVPTRTRAPVTRKPRMTAPATTQQTTIVQNAIKYATAQVGKPYIWGGTGPKGYDCSGLLYMAYRSAGYPNITRTTHTQVAQGVALDPAMPINQRPPGVLIFPDAGHVYMSLGGGQIVEAATFGVPIHVRNDYTTRAYAIRQLVPVNAVATGGGDFTMSPAVAVTSGLADGAAGVVTGITADFISHVIDVVGNWLTYIGVVLLGTVIGAAGLFWIAERPASFLRRALPL